MTQDSVKAKVTNLENKSIAQNASVIAFFTALSRVAGLVRDIVIFHVFGASAITDAFFVAFTIPNMLRRFVAEGALTVAFIPVYTEVRTNTGQKAATDFLKATLGFMLIVLSGLVLAGIFGAKYFVYGFASGFTNDPAKMALTIHLTQVLFSYVAFISLVALAMGALNAHRHFAAPAAAPILLNISIIFSTIFLANLFVQPIFAVAVGVVIGGIAQLILQGLFLARFNLLVWPKLDFSLAPFQKLMRLLIPSVFGVAVYQLNLVVLRQLGSYLPDGQISYYYNADRLMQFALGVFAISIATAALPSMSSQSARRDKTALLQTWAFSTRLTNFITIPAAFGLFAIAVPLVSVLYLHGKFNINDVMLTAYTTMAFAPGLIAVAITRTTIQAFFALEDMKTPVYVGILIVLMNIGVGLLLLRYQVVGLGATLSISSIAQTLVLILLLRRKLGHLGGGALLRSVVVQSSLALLAALAAYFVAMLGAWELELNVKNLGVLLLALGIGVTLYIGLALKLKLNEAQTVYQTIFKHRKKKA